MNSIRCLTIAILSFSLTACATWPTETKVEESTWLALQAVDGAQTADIQNHRDAYEQESAFLIGRQPSTRSVATYFAAAAALHVGITEYMSANDWPLWARRTFEALTIADSARCVVGNADIGLHVEF